MRKRDVVSPGFEYGGQAVLEGVMIRGPQGLAIAVRRPDRKIVIERRSIPSLASRSAVWRFPIIRGAVQLYQALVIGIDALIFSANQVAETEEEQISKSEMTITMAVAFGLAILLFVIAPTLLVQWLNQWIQSSTVLNFIEGAIRLVILLGYIASISFMSDIRRVLEYHGAEHKVIHALENNDDLTVEAVRGYPIFHPRCGTSFLLLVGLVSIFLFTFFGWPGFWERLLIRLGSLPLVAGIAYELIRASGRSRSALWRPIIAPGLWLQRLTVREPDDDQIEVAICALKEALAVAADERAVAKYA